jgi:hypothetical protein
MIKTETMYCISNDGTQLEYGAKYDGEVYGTYFHTNGSRYSADRFSMNKPPTGEPMHLKPKAEIADSYNFNDPSWSKLMNLANLSKKHKCEAYFVELLTDGLI